MSPWMRLSPFVIASVFAFARADDGWVGNGGTPKLMTAGHAQIRMVDEVVRVHVGKKLTTVDCMFHFRNDGSATTVRMGFPDESMNRESDEKVKTVFRRFHSWVDGRPVPTRFEGSMSTGYWHLKTVPFPAHGRRTVRDRYVVATGAGVQGSNYLLRYAAYTLHTGASWKGPIGRAEVVFTFAPDLPQPKRVIPYQALDWKTRYRPGDEAATLPKRLKPLFERNVHTVFWSGFAKPTVRNGVVRFVGRNLEPEEEDDLFLALAPFQTVYHEKPDRTEEIEVREKGF